MNIDKLYDNHHEINKRYEFFISKEQLIKKNTKGLAQAHISKAKHNLEFFEKNKQNYNFKDWLIVILYYSLYHCALALVTNKNYVSKNHTATLIFLLKEYNISKEEANLLEDLSISKNDAKFYDTLKTQRHYASYNTNYAFSEEIINNYKKRVIEFMQKTMEIIQNANPPN